MIDPDDVPSAGGDVPAFVAKWRGAWPEWSVVEGFVPVAERDVGAAWQALQFELQEAAWGGTEARPGEAKLAWWSEELAGWTQGRRRHPLGAVLQRCAAPWADLARAITALATSRVRPATEAEARGQLAPVVGAVAAVEAALLGGRAAVEAVEAAWLHARLARHPGHAVPASESSAASWGAQLARTWPAARGLPATRRIELALARARLRAGDASSPLGPLRALWMGWRAARD